MAARILVRWGPVLAVALLLVLASSPGSRAQTDDASAEALPGSAEHTAALEAQVAGLALQLQDQEGLLGDAAAQIAGLRSEAAAASAGADRIKELETTLRAAERKATAAAAAAAKRVTELEAEAASAAARVLSTAEYAAQARRASWAAATKLEADAVEAAKNHEAALEALRSEHAAAAAAAAASYATEVAAAAARAKATAKEMHVRELKAVLEQQRSKIVEAEAKAKKAEQLLSQGQNLMHVAENGRHATQKKLTAAEEQVVTERTLRQRLQTQLEAAQAQLAVAQAAAAAVPEADAATTALLHVAYTSWLPLWMHPHTPGVEAPPPFLQDLDAEKVKHVTRVAVLEAGHKLEAYYLSASVLVQAYAVKGTALVKGLYKEHLQELVNVVILAPWFQALQKQVVESEAQTRGFVTLQLRRVGAPAELLDNDHFQTATALVLMVLAVQLSLLPVRFMTRPAKPRPALKKKAAVAGKPAAAAKPAPKAAPVAISASSSKAATPAPAAAASKAAAPAAPKAAAPAPAAKAAAAAAPASSSKAAKAVPAKGAATPATASKGKAKGKAS